MSSYSIWDDTEHPDSAEVRRLRSEIERLREALERVVDHDPKVPGLHYDSTEQLLESAIAIARTALT